jgi:hypothetical protein
MFILRDILLPLQDHFSQTDLGREGASLFVYTILSIIVPFTSTMTSNVWRCLDTLVGFHIKNKPFYTFMASTTLPWISLWKTIWGLILGCRNARYIEVILSPFFRFQFH